VSRAASLRHVVTTRPHNLASSHNVEVRLSRNFCLRAGEIDEALTSANAAVEAALKAVGMKGKTLGALAKSFTGSQHLPGYLADVAEHLEGLLGKLMAASRTEGDAHGKPPGSKPGEQALGDLAVYWAGAFIVYLADAVP
jgi:hypothetical protein